MMNKKAIKVISIILAALMALSVLAVILQVVAVDESYTALPVTGESNTVYIVAGCVLAAAVLAIVGALVIPKIKQKKNASKQDKDA